MNIIIDMGTSNLRIYICDHKNLIASASLGLGSKYTLNMTKSELYKNINTEIAKLTNANKITENAQGVYVFGMGGSEYGIYEVDRITLPIDKKTVAENLTCVSLPELYNAPIYIIPGVYFKKENFTEFMRGEETETIGFMEENSENCSLILPGSHCKNIKIKNGKIVDFCSTLTGEMTQALSENTILRASVDLKESLDEVFLFKGAECAKKIGINAALLNVRGLECEKTYTKKQITSYFLGVVFIGDVLYNLEFSGNLPIYIGGKSSLQRIYSLLFNRYGKNTVTTVSGGSDLGYKGVLSIINEKRKANNN